MLTDIMSTPDRSGADTWFLLTLSVLVVSLILFACLEAGFLDHLSLDFLRRVKKLPPQIAYKKAVLKGPSSPQHFGGVVAEPYAADAVKNRRSPGFHAYSDFASAREHEQEGNVLLEVLLSGTISEKAKGFVAERQRVLQVIPYKCTGSYQDFLGHQAWEVCDRVPRHYTLSQGDDVLFFCSKHKWPQMKRRSKESSSRLMAFLKQERTKPSYVWTSGPIRHLPTMLPWLSEHRIVVAELEGPDKFVPTAIPTSPDSAPRK